MGMIALIAFIAEMTQEPKYWWDQVPGFYMIFGFLGCLALVGFAKTLGKILVQKSEDYYDVR